MNGYVRVIYSKGGCYNGHFKNGNKNGYGMYFYGKKLQYCGYYKDGHYNGYGKYLYSHGKIEEGQMLDGKLNGYARVTAKGITTYGIYKNDELEKEMDLDTWQEEQFEIWEKA